MDAVAKFVLLEQKKIEYFRKKSKSLMKHFLPIILLFLSFQTIAQTTATEELQINRFIKGTLRVPAAEKPPLVIMVQGSGPTDRNGNQSFARNDSFKKLAAALAENGIATYRFDKRIMRMRELGIQEEDMRFQDFVTDVNSALEYFSQADNFGKVVVLGHSQGSLVGMLAAKENADAFISIAGAAQPIDSIIIEQVANQMPGLAQNVRESFGEMRASGSSKNYNPVLESIFRPSVQPFILSWMQHNPKEEIKNLNIPVLLINGTKDLQVKEQESKILKTAQPAAELVILEDMNHVLRKVEGGELENSKTYNQPGLPLHPELVPEIVNFIENL